jgi:hypothetical protein
MGGRGQREMPRVRRLAQTPSEACVKRAGTVKLERVFRGAHSADRQDERELQILLRPRRVCVLQQVDEFAVGIPQLVWVHDLVSANLMRIRKGVEEER